MKLLKLSTSRSGFRRAFCAGLGVVAIAFSSVASAEYITYTFGGPAQLGFQSVSPPLPPPGGPPPPPPQFPLVELPPGFDNYAAVSAQTISGYITVNTTGTDFNSLPDRGSYSGPAVLPLFYIDFNGYTFAYDYRDIRPGSFVNVAVFDTDTPQGTNTIASNFIDARASLGTGIFAGPTSSRYVVSLRAIFNTFDLNVIESDALPTDLSTFGSWTMLLAIVDPVTNSNATYQTTTALHRYVPVPEPAAASLFMFGGLVMIFVARGRRLKK